MAVKGVTTSLDNDPAAEGLFVIGSDAQGPRVSDLEVGVRVKEPIIGATGEVGRNRRRPRCLRAGKDEGDREEEATTDVGGIQALHIILKVNKLSEHH